MRGAEREEEWERDQKLWCTGDYGKHLLLWCICDGVVDRKFCVRVWQFHCKEFSKRFNSLWT